MTLRTPPVVRRRLTPAPGSDCGGDRHGTYIAVRENGCSCPDALDDRYRYEKAQRTGTLQPAHVDATGTVRKLQAMNALGYGGHYLAGQLDTAGSYVLNLMRGAKDSVHRRTADRVDELYRELSSKPAEWNPDYCPHLTEAERGWRIEKTKATADERGYASPMRWDGARINDPAALPEGRGPQTAHTAAEDDADTVRALIDSGADPGRVREAYRQTPRAHRAAVVEALTARGYSAVEVAERVGASSRQVERYRAAAREETATAEDETAEAVRMARELADEVNEEDVYDMSEMEADVDTVAVL